MLIHTYFYWQKMFARVYLVLTLVFASPVCLLLLFSCVLVLMGLWFVWDVCFNVFIHIFPLFEKVPLIPVSLEVSL